MTQMSPPLDVYVIRPCMLDRAAGRIDAELDSAAEAPHGPST